MGYLFFWLTRNGIFPENKKAEAVLNITPPNNIIQVRASVGLLNYYRDMWAKRSHSLQPFTAITSTKVTFKWTDVKQQAFDKIKQMVARDTLLIYPVIK